MEKIELEFGDAAKLLSEWMPESYDERFDKSYNGGREDGVVPMDKSILGYKIGDDPVGFVYSFNYDKDIDNIAKRIGECSIVAVSPDHRRKGIGTRLLLDSMEDRASYPIDIFSIWSGLSMEKIVMGIMASGGFNVVDGGKAREVLLHLSSQFDRDHVINRVGEIRSLVEKKYDRRAKL